MTKNRLETDIVVVGSGTGGAAIGIRFLSACLVNLLAHIRVELPNELYLTAILFSVEMS